ncbi:MAG: YceI family protein [Pirellulales bacterium]
MKYLARFMALGALSVLPWLTYAVAESAEFEAQQTGSKSKALQVGDIHLGSSRAFVYVGKSGLVGHNHGIEGHIREGRIDLPQSINAGKIVFEMNSFDADTDTARRYMGLEGSTDAGTRKEVTANMQGEHVLDVARYPTATFTIESIQPVAGKSPRGFDQYQFAGKFTLHGVTNPLRVVVEAEPRQPWMHLRCRFDVLQSDYGITPFSKVFGTVGVADALRIWGDLWVLNELPQTQASATGQTRTK